MTARQVGNALASFSLVDGGRGVRVQDELEHNDLTLWTDTAVSLQQVSTDRFVFPVDVAASVSTTELRVPRTTAVYLRDGTGEHLGEFSETARELPTGTYFLELSGAAKTYVRLPAVSFTGRVVPEEGVYVFAFDSETAVDIGTRSLHRRPRATMTVPHDPEALLKAVSMLGSSIKEFSPERSWPTLRGHPPAIETGPELSVPDELTVPDTGITITVPPTYADAYRVTPLAFYLGASVEPGSERALHLDVGYTEPLGADGEALEASVDDLLARCFLLDSLTRVGGYYSLPRAEYDELAAHLSFYPPNLYDAPVAEQLLEYLEVPVEALEPHLPEWPMSATLRPRLADAPLLPFLSHSLARVRVSEDGVRRDPRETVSEPAVRATAHGNPRPGAARLSEPALTHGLSDSLGPVERARIRLVGVSEAALSGAREFSARRVDAVADGPGELFVTDAVTCEELRAELRRDGDFLYHGGGTTERGLVCSDGVLPFEAVEEVGVGMVAFDGATRVDGALRLANAGATAALVAESTLDDLTAGRLAGYLLAGYPLHASVALAGISVSCRYVGDPTRVLVRREGGEPALSVDVTSASEDEHQFSVRAHLSDADRLGTVTRIRDAYAQDAYHLTGARVEQPHRLTTAEVIDLVRDDDLAVRLNGTVQRGNDADAAAVRRSARRALDRKPD